MRSGFIGGAVADSRLDPPDRRLQLVVHGLSDTPGVVVRLGNQVEVVTEPGLHVKMPLLDSVIYIDKRILDLENQPQG